MEVANIQLIGYADKLSVVTGEKIRFMVSSEASSYAAKIVRLTRPDLGSDGPEFREEVVDSAISGRYNGRRQPVFSGSYAVVADSPALQLEGSMALQAWVYPTTPRNGRAQGLLTKWSAAEGFGYGLFIEEDGDLALWIGDGETQKFRTGKALRGREWYFVACSYDTAEEKVALVQEPVTPWPLDESSAVLERSTSGVTPRPSEAPLLIAGGHYDTDERRREFVRDLYNGKIDGPRVFGRALDLEELAALKRGSAPEDVGGKDVIAAWDFAADASSAKITDTSVRRLNGKTVNTPVRAMTGHNWTHKEDNFRLAPEEYGAIHFHEDDLEDAGWDQDFELTVPEQLRSGVYAARLSADGAEEYVPFYVRPKKGSPTAPVAFLAPTNTYLAYANERLYHGNDFSAFKDQPITLAPEDVYLGEHPELAPSLYDHHMDGSGCHRSSRLRPILNMRPGYRTWLNDGPRHFAADLVLIGWLEEKGHRHDVITDEDLHFDGEELLSPYRVVVTGTHPEYWTTPMMLALERYLNEGGRVMYLGGNGLYWVTSFDPERPHCIEIRRGLGSLTWESLPGETYHATTGEQGGIWRHRGLSSHKLVGVSITSQGWGGAAGYVRQPGSFDERASFIFEGVGDDEVIGDFGLGLGGAAGDELDRMDHDLGTPPHTLLLATSAGRHTDYYYQPMVEDIPLWFPEAAKAGSENPRIRADMVYFETPKGGAVFSVGSISWCNSLPLKGYDNNVSRITDNVLRKFSS